MIDFKKEVQPTKESVISSLESMEPVIFILPGQKFGWLGHHFFVFVKYRNSHLGELFFGWTFRLFWKHFVLTMEKHGKTSQQEKSIRNHGAAEQAKSKEQNPFDKLACKTHLWESSWGSLGCWKSRVAWGFFKSFLHQTPHFQHEHLLKSEILMNFMGISFWWMLLDTKTITLKPLLLVFCSNSRRTLRFFPPPRSSGPPTIGHAAPQTPEFPWCETLGIFAFDKTQVFNVFFLGRKTKTELKSLRQIYPPSTEVKEFLLFFHSLKSLFLLLRPLVSNWAIPTRCTTSASNWSRTSTVACPGDHVCKDIKYIGRKMCVYLQQVNVYVYDMHIIGKEPKYT